MNLLKVLTEEELFLLANKAGCLLAVDGFWDYCIAVDSDFYTDDKVYLRTFVDTLENFYYGRLIAPSGKPYTKIVINMPPQHGKTRTLVHFCEWTLGRDNEERIITASYNDSTASDFSRYVRDGIQTDKLIEDDISFRDLFPGTSIKKGHGGFEKWALSGQHFNYLGAGIGGSITSKGGTILIVDDPIKGAVEAFSANYLNKCWDWYTGTFISRVSAKLGKPLEIFVMTRWSTRDPVGRLLEDKETAEQWYVLSMEAYNEETNEMLHEQTLSYERYKYIERIMPRPIFLANYHQQPIEFEGALYSDLGTYTTLPIDEKGNSLFEGICSYTDTADTGDDFLCSLIYGKYMGRAYILDAIYTKDKMEITEPALAIMLEKHNSSFNKIESNNGGRGFARNVARIYFERYERNLPVSWFHQSQNKQARIFTNSANVCENILFPADWHNRWPKLFKDIMSYTKEGKNDYDDAPDTLTGIVEEIVGKTKAATFKNVY